MASSLRTDEEIAAIYHRNIDTVYRICFSYMKNKADAEDMSQETFLKLMACGRQFESESHEKAWLIVTASNTCKDALKRHSRKKETRLDVSAFAGLAYGERDCMLDAVLDLPAKYKTPVYLFYYEGYTAAEIAEMLRCPQSTVRNWLSKARKLLKKYCN